MGTKDLTLNIAVNLNRLARFSAEGRQSRVTQFLHDTDFYMSELQRAPKSPRFAKTYLVFAKNYQDLKNNPQLNEDWAERALTWSNILTHRAKLA